MVKEGKKIFCLSLIILLSVSFVSASWFGNFWNKITGNVVEETKITPASATASSVYLSNTADKVIDGNLETYWSAGAYAPQWIEIDLGATYSVSKIKLLVQQSPNGNTIHKIYMGSSSNPSLNVYNFSGYTSASQWIEKDFSSSIQNVRYIRVLTTNSPASWIGWNEIEIYNSSEIVEPVTCTDSDGGKNYNLKGNVTGGGLVPLLKDFCTPDGFYLFEYFCNDSGDVNTEKYYCANGCENSACVILENSTTTSSSDLNCIDTDGGRNYNLKGNISGGGGVNISDFCTPDGYVYEYFCNDSGYSDGEKYYCANGCESGACTNLNCLDSDEGREIYTKGNISGGRGVNISDFCTPDGYVYEYFCNDSGYSEGEKYPCANGCDGGKCNLPENKTKAVCDAIREGGPEIQPKTRLKIGSSIKYCDPIELNYLDVKSSYSECVADYECTSNVCADGVCISIKKELEKQTNLLKKIWCKIINPLNEENYLTCLEE